MSLQGFSLTDVGSEPHLGEQPVLAAVRSAMPDGAISAVIAEAGVQERRKRRLPAQLMVSFVIALGLWPREGLVDGLKNLVDGLREQDPGPWRAWQPPVK